MTIKHQLEPIIEKWNLLNHPFYQAWSSGTLPMDALRLYAVEYGRFISMLPRAWETLGDGETAEEESQHAALWEHFRIALGDGRSYAAIPQVTDLVLTAEELFSEPATSLGALFAFEVQQPATASSKLAGLKAHYKLPETVEPYFLLHSQNEHESLKLLVQLEEISTDGQRQALMASSRMAAAMWNALTGIHQAAGGN